MLDNVTCHIEGKIIPQTWTANTLTIIGNIPMILLGLLVIYEGGVSYDDKFHQDLPRYLYFLSAFCFLWFSWFDIMDGQRARRLKCGSSIGRIIDEAGDVFQYTWLSVVVGHLLKLPPGLLNLSYAAVNLPAYTMEIKFIFTGKLVLNPGVDELGPVEMELLLTIIMLICGTFGVEGL